MIFALVALVAVVAFIVGGSVDRISKREHLFVTAMLNRRVEDQQVIARDLRRQLLDITAKYHQLRLLNPNIAPVEPPPPPPPPPPRDRLIEEIDDRFGHNDTLRSAALRQLAADRDEGMNDDEILRQIIEGQAVEEGTPA